MSDVLAGMEIFGFEHGGRDLPTDDACNLHKKGIKKKIIFKYKFTVGLFFKSLMLA